jgi:hypothetical protein
MACKRWMIAATAVCALAMMAGSAQSAPLGNAATDFWSDAAASSGLKRVAQRLCWTEGGARQCRWVDNARIFRGSRVSGYAAPRAYGYRAARVSRYAPRYAPRRVYGYRAAPAFGYAAPPILAYSAPPVSGDVAPPAYLDSLAPVPAVIAPPVLAYSPAPVYGYAAGPGAYAYQGPRPIVRFYRRLTPAIEYANPDLYPAGTPAWWAVMNRQDRGGQPN